MTGSRSFKWVGAILLSTGAVVGSAQAQHTGGYAGQQERSIKALSDEEVKQYLAGGGMGYAKAAELNHYPGPMHVLELADQLGLSAEQRSQTMLLMNQHKAEARDLGKKVVAAERALDEVFKSGRANQTELAQKVSAASVAQGEFRLSHLDTHVRMRALLSDAQVARYDMLRGYASGARQGSHDHRH